MWIVNLLLSINSLTSGGRHRAEIAVGQHQGDIWDQLKLVGELVSVGVAKVCTRNAL